MIITAKYAGNCAKCGGNISPDAMKLFHDTIRKQLETEYDQKDFNRYLSGIFNYSTEELSKMGKTFRHGQ